MELENCWREFKNQELALSVRTYIDSKGIVWFKGKDVALALGYAKPRNAILNHVDEDYKGAPVKGPLRGEQPHTIWISEPGVYSLIFSSMLKSAKEFQKWVFSEVLPNIRRYGQYKVFNSPNRLVFKIENEFDLHSKVVECARRFYPNAILVASLGKLQDTKSKRINSYKKGYQRGKPDIIVQNLHKRYNGLCIEFKTPLGLGKVSEDQKLQLHAYEMNNFKTIVSNEYDSIITQIIHYMRDARILCEFCKNKGIRFKNHNTLANHKRYFHRIL